MLWRQARAKVLARRGDHAEAERLAREAVAIAESTDFLNEQADTYADLAEVLSVAGRAQEAALALGQALRMRSAQGQTAFSVQHACRPTRRAPAHSVSATRLSVNGATRDVNPSHRGVATPAPVLEDEPVPAPSFLRPVR